MVEKAKVLWAVVVMVFTMGRYKCLGFQQELILDAQTKDLQSLGVKKMK